MNITVTPETVSEWSAVLVDDVQVGAVRQSNFAKDETYKFYAHDFCAEEFSSLQLAEINRVGNETAAVLNITRRLKGNS